jgi:hypothetical protein
MAILLLLLAILVIATIHKPSYGLMVYIAIRLCIPHTARFFGFSLNTMALALFLTLAIGFIIKRIHILSFLEKKYLRNLITYISILLVLTTISSVTAIVPISYQIPQLVQYIYTEFLPSFLFLILFIDKKDYMILNYVLAVCIILSCSYTIYTFIIQGNPLYEFFSTDKDKVLDYADAGMSRMLLGAGAGIMNNKITTSLLSLLFFTYFWGKNIVNKFVVWTVLALSFTSALLTTQRTSLICLFLFVLINILNKGHVAKRIISSFAAIMAIILLLLYFIPDVEDMSMVFLSAFFIWNDNYQSDIGVGGSSMEMRIDQFRAVLEITNIHLLEGLGYNFAKYFDEVLNLANTTMGDRLKGFESLVFKMITSFGLIGLIAYLNLMVNLLKMAIGKLKSNSRYIISFFAIYLLAIIMTDDSGTSYLFFIFIALNIIYNRIYVDTTVLAVCEHVK